MISKLKPNPENTKAQSPESERLHFSIFSGDPIFLEKVIKSSTTPTVPLRSFLRRIIFALLGREQIQKNETGIKCSHFFAHLKFHFGITRAVRLDRFFQNPDCFFLRSDSSFYWLCLGFLFLFLSLLETKRTRPRGENTW